jgi:hypothetical protein
MTTTSDAFDHFFVPIGTLYVPLTRVTRRIAKPRLLRFEGDAEDVFYGDAGSGIRRIVETPKEDVS